MQHLQQLFQTGDKFASHCGMELVSLAAGHAVTRLAIQPWHRNAVGIVQGGAIFTLADFAFGAASNSQGRVAVGVNVGITYLKAAKAGVITAEAREVAATPKLASYTVDVTDEDGQLLAVFQGLAYLKKETHRPAGGS